MTALAKKALIEESLLADNTNVQQNERSNQGTGHRKPVQKSAEAFRTIGEAAAELGLKPHVLRFWETKFPQIKPMKRSDKRRFYRPADMQLLRAIQKLLHEDGLTIKGAKRILAHTRADQIIQSESLNMTSKTPGKSVKDLQNAVQQAVEGGAFRAPEQTEESTDRLEGLLSDLTDLKSKLDQVRKAS
jgi:DNA-binding transcriptional MerR regulator